MLERTRCDIFVNDDVNDAGVASLIEQFSKSHRVMPTTNPRHFRLTTTDLKAVKTIAGNDARVEPHDAPAVTR